MNFGNTAEYCEAFYQWLIHHDLLDKVLYNYEHYQWHENIRHCKYGPLNHLFNWEKTEDGLTYWANIHRTSPSYFQISQAPTVGEIINYLRDKQQTITSYEFW